MTDAQRPMNAPSAVLLPPELASAPAIAVRGEGAGEIAPAGGATLEEHHAEFASFEQDYISRYIELADTKAAWSFAVAAGLVAYQFSVDFQNEQIAGWIWFLWGTSLALLLCSAAFSFLVIAPRLSGAAKGIVYFGSVSQRKNADAYISEIAGKSAVDLTGERLAHAYEIARICTQKYRNLRRAIWIGVPALILVAAWALLV